MSLDVLDVIPFISDTFALLADIRIVKMGNKVRIKNVANTLFPF